MNPDQFSARFRQALADFQNSNSKDIAVAALCVQKAGLPVLERNKIVWALLNVAAYTHEQIDHDAQIQTAHEQAFPWWRRRLWDLQHLLEQEALIPDPLPKHRE